MGYMSLYGPTLCLESVALYYLYVEKSFWFGAHVLVCVIMIYNMMILTNAALLISHIQL